MSDAPAGAARWLNRTVLGIGIASLFSDWSHEIATTLMPAFLASMGAAAAWLGLIEGVADGLSSLVKPWAGLAADRLTHRKPLAIAGYVVTALGTAATGLATRSWHVLLARSAAWLGRGLRTPARKALLAAAVGPGTYGRAFGFERMMDSVGAVIGPITALLLLGLLDRDYTRLFALTLIPGLAAAVAIALFVRERSRTPATASGVLAGFGALPPRFRTLVIAVGMFGLGDFSHTLLILLAVRTLTPTLGPTAAAATAAGLYVLHNLVYAGGSWGAGLLADRLPKARVLAAGYLLAAAMALIVVAVPLNVWSLGAVFTLGGLHVAIAETLEDAFCAEMVPEERRGAAFGLLATVNGIGDLASSIVVGALWTAWNAPIAFVWTVALSLAGALLVLRLAGEPPPASVRG